MSTKRITIMNNIKLNDNDLLDFMVDRVRYMADNSKTARLYGDCFSYQIGIGLFTEGNIDVAKHVDDFYNNTFVLYKSDSPEYTAAVAAHNNYDNEFQFENRNYYIEYVAYDTDGNPIFIIYP